MAASPTIFQSSDLNQRGRAVLDAARSGEARIRDKDGLGLVILPEQRLNALKAVARAAASLFALEMALAASPEREPDLHELGEWTWLREFDREDVLEFMNEMRKSLLIAGREETESPVEETLYRWRVTAEALEDPARRRILLEAHRDDDFVEVERPG